MEYSKPPLSFEAQADRLISRGLVGERAILITRLKSVSYYRLSGYLYPFRNPDDSYVPGTSLVKVWDLYTFDRQLRILVLDAIERIEIAIRANIVYLHTQQHGPFGYAVAATIPNLTASEHVGFITKFSTERRHSREVFVRHFTAKYGDQNQHLPFWMASEIMTFGMLLTILSGAAKTIRQQLAQPFGISEEVFLSWMRSIGGARNICAHHARLWNREFGYKPLIPRRHKHPEWHEPVEVKEYRLFGLLTVLKYMLNYIAPQSRWPDRLTGLLDRYPEVPRSPMGFPVNWKDCPIWQ